MDRISIHRGSTDVNTLVLKIALGVAIREIRRRLGKNMVEFGRMLGVRQNSISRYEAGSVVPSRAVLMLLWDLAETDPEKEAISQALGSKPDEIEAAVARFERDARLVSAEFERVLEGHRKSPETRRLFADLALQILDSPEIPLEVLGVLRLWVRAGTKPGVRAEFQDALTRLEIRVELQEREEGHPPGRMSSKVLRVMIRCPQTGRELPTGAFMTAKEFEATGFEHMEASCPHCHSIHYWNKKDAFLEGAA